MLEVKADVTLFGGSVVKPDVLAIIRKLVAADAQLSFAVVAIHETQCPIGCGNVEELNGVDGAVEVVEPRVPCHLLSGFGFACVHPHQILLICSHSVNTSCASTDMPPDIL